MQKNSFKKALMRVYPESLILRRAICTAIALFVAVLVDHYYSILHEFWVSLTTVLLLQLTLRSDFRLEMQRFGVIALSVLFGSLFVVYVSSPLLVNAMMIAVFVLGCFLHSYYPPRSHGFSPPLVVALIALMMLVPFVKSPDVIYARLHDVVLGGIIGIVAGMVIFPGRPDVDFRTGLVPVLKAYSAYLTAIAELFFQTTSAGKAADVRKADIEKTLQTRQAFFPDWVYEEGFNASLREGHRHFLLRVEQLGAILFAMHYQVRHTLRTDLLEQLQQPIKLCLDDAKNLIDDLCVVLESADLKAAYYDLTGNVMALENFFNTQIAVPFELIDTSKDYVHITGLIYDIRDLQHVLVKLEESLRGYITHVDELN